MNRLTPPATYGEFCDRVCDLCVMWNLSITGAGRTKLRNSAKGGLHNSKHLWSRGGYAIDCVPDDNYQSSADVIATEQVVGRFNGIGGFRHLPIDLGQSSTQIFKSHGELLKIAVISWSITPAIPDTVLQADYF